MAQGLGKILEHRIVIIYYISSVFTGHFIPRHLRPQLLGKVIPLARGQLFQNTATLDPI